MVNETTVQARPHGLGIAVVFDWALTAQLTTQALASATRTLGFTPNPLVLISLIGVVSLVMLVTGQFSGSLLFTTAIELGYAPWLVWRLLDKETAAWFAMVRGRGRAPHVSGWQWVAVLAAWAIVWGVVVAWAESL
jgi:hypothetical protein